MEAYRIGEYGRAIRQFRLALEKQPVFPEATAAIGRAYEMDRSFDLAERYYLEALSRSAQLYVPEDKYAISYDLAALYAVEGRSKDYIDVLSRVINDHPLSADIAENRQLKASYLRTLRDDGIDRLLTLFRMPLDFAHRAYSESGIFHLKSQRYGVAVLHLSVAVIQVVSTVVEEIRRTDLDYEYESLAEILALIGESDELMEFANRSNAFSSLYYLAAALFGDRSLVAAGEIWTALAESPIAGPYQRRSRLQLESPEAEPIIE
jgi:tetratricopeptide (TPR) repeat protein